MQTARQLLRLAAVVALGLLAAACGGSDEMTGAEPAEAQQRFPDIVAADVERVDETFTFRVTVSSPYDTPERYADGWRIVGPDGTVFGEHTLTHDHASEQPFTRTQTGVAIPADVTEVVIEGRDLVNGYGGGTLTVVLP